MLPKEEGEEGLSAPHSSLCLRGGVHGTLRLKVLCSPGASAS